MGLRSLLADHIGFFFQSRIVIHWQALSLRRRLHAALPPSVVLCLDGAYAEFCHDPAYEDGMSMVREFDNVVVTRTFSKLHGLAALRVGWAYMPAEMADAVDRIRLPFNLNIPAQLAAVAPLLPASLAAGVRADLLRADAEGYALAALAIQPATPAKPMILNTPDTRNSTPRAARAIEIGRAHV